MLDPFSLQQMDCSGISWIEYVCKYFLGFNLMFCVNTARIWIARVLIVVFECGMALIFVLSFMSGFSELCLISCDRSRSLQRDKYSSMQYSLGCCVESWILINAFRRLRALHLLFLKRDEICVSYMMQLVP
ncbi:hypothetical protein KC19_VG167300 [Ceratodon purpureus]|uniref:Uncharacterized protein n=1 Tax=Ceratodon purpureus TaxID=3225 RepID=A0A8T0HR83_CERPU|nr:hypothetical protein KC19_VG167300 [Ceratodon purpureus]